MNLSIKAQKSQTLDYGFEEHERSHFRNCVFCHFQDSDSLMALSRVFLRVQLPSFPSSASSDSHARITHLRPSVSSNFVPVSSLTLSCPSSDTIHRDPLQLIVATVSSEHLSTRCRAPVQLPRFRKIILPSHQPSGAAALRGPCRWVSGPALGPSSAEISPAQLSGRRGLAENAEDRSSTHCCCRSSTLFH